MDVEVYKYILHRNKSHLHSLVSKKHFSCTGDAFVCFKSERDKHKCLSALNRYVICTIPRYRSRWLKCEEATDPDDIIWENFEYKWYHTIWRKLIGLAVTICSTIFVLILAFILERVRMSLGSNASLATAIQTKQYKNEIIINFVITIVIGVTTAICGKILSSKYKL